MDKRTRMAAAVFERLCEWLKSDPPDAARHTSGWLRSPETIVDEDTRTVNFVGPSARLVHLTDVAFNLWFVQMSIGYLATGQRLQALEVLNEANGNQANHKWDLMRTTNHNLVRLRIVAPYDHGCTPSVPVLLYYVENAYHAVEAMELTFQNLGLSVSTTRPLPTADAPRKRNNPSPTTTVIDIDGDDEGGEVLWSTSVIPIHRAAGSVVDAGGDELGGLGELHLPQLGHHQEGLRLSGRKMSDDARMHPRARQDVRGPGRIYGRRLRRTHEHRPLIRLRERTQLGRPSG